MVMYFMLRIQMSNYETQQVEVVERDERQRSACKTRVNKCVGYLCHNTIHFSSYAYAVLTVNHCAVSRLQKLMHQHL